MAQKITTERLLAALERDDYTGFCLGCGSERDGCEPDARRYECYDCGENKVWGAEELLFHLHA